VNVRFATRRVVLTGVAVLSGAVLAGCGSSDSGSMPGMDSGATTAPTGSTTAPTSSAAASFATADVEFARQMVPHHQQAIAMAAMADTRAADTEVKELAGQVKTSQEPEIATLTGWLAAWGQPAPQASKGHGMDMGGAAMPGMMTDADMSKLMAASGKAFDKQFLTMMIAHHEGAVSMANDQAAQGKNADAIALAKQMATSQQAEITRMKAMLDRL
jgi:uncharacterized protein (DUF305 family)